MKTKERNVVLELIGTDLGEEFGLQRELEARALNVTVSSRGDDGLVQALKRIVDVVVSDISMPGISGLELLTRLRLRKPALPVILTSAFGTTDNAIEAARLGAYEYVKKPFEAPRFADLIAKAALCKRNSRVRLETKGVEVGPTGLIGSGPVMDKLYGEIGRAAASSMTVLIRGATGTGKELVARAIHDHGNRSKQPFIVVNCGALTEPLFESELFGHERGAFTGAHERRVGRFEAAHCGTLFLDEIGDLSHALQVKLLRVLQEKKVVRVGSNKDISVDVRVLAATNAELDKLIAAKEFRPDLFYRLGAFTICTPELREHLEDVPALAKHFLHRFGSEMGNGAPSMEGEAKEFLQVQVWPGNVRQLENVILHAALMARNEPIALAHVRNAYHEVQKPPADGASSTHRFSELLAKARDGEQRNVLYTVQEEAKCSLIKEAMGFAGGNQSKVAEWLGVGRTTLRQTLRQIGFLQAKQQKPSVRDHC